MQLQHSQVRTAQCPAWRVSRPAESTPHQHHRPARQRLLHCRASSSSSSSAVGAEEAMRLVQREGWKILDVRSARAWDQQHITKPARVSVSAPAVLNDNSSPNPNFLADVAAQAPKSKLLVMCEDGGSWSDAALRQLEQAGYSDVMRLEGGYAGWGQVWSPSGKRRPPPGRWVSTGKEALKSGLNIPGVAESYDEGGNLTTARFARGLKEGEELPPSSSW